MKTWKSNLALWAFALLVTAGLFTRLELSPEPPAKGFCAMCNGPYKAMVLGTYAPVGR